MTEHAREILEELAENREDLALLKAVVKAAKEYWRITQRNARGNLDELESSVFNFLSDQELKKFLSNRDPSKSLDLYYEAEDRDEDQPTQLIDDLLYDMGVEEIENFHIDFGDPARLGGLESQVYMILHNEWFVKEAKLVADARARGDIEQLVY